MATDWAVRISLSTFVSNTVLRAAFVFIPDALPNIWNNGGESDLQKQLAQ
jgi:hypothetical protein